MAKRVEKTSETKCLTQILEPELPDIFNLEEGDVFYSQTLGLTVVIESTTDTKIVIYENGTRRSYKIKSFRAYLVNINAIPSHKVALEAYIFN